MSPVSRSSKTIPKQKLTDITKKRPLDLMHDDIIIVLIGYKYPEKKYLVINTQTLSYIRIKPRTPTI